MTENKKDIKKSEEIFKQNEEQFHKAILHAPFPVMIHADDGEVLSINNVWTELTGYTHEEIPTLFAWTERAYGERKDIVKSRIDKIFDCDTRVEEGEYFITSKDGKKLIWEFSSAPLGELSDGRRIVISIAVSITDRKKAEEELKKKLDEMTTMNAFMIDRELKMIELKKQINGLLEELGRPKEFNS